MEKSLLIKITTRLLMMAWLIGVPTCICAETDTIVPSGFEQLDAWTRRCKQDRPNALGYPGNYNSHLDGFYAWYTANGMENILINNAGDPFGNAGALSSVQFEREVIEYFAPLYGFDRNDLWGMVTMSGTDGNNHGIYFGVNYLRGLTGKMPIVYVSDEAHYSNYRLCDLQHLEVRLVKTNAMGQMIPDSLEAVLDVSRPCLMIYAMGSTFKGAIDDQQALNAVLARHPEMPVYKHIDAALFGGYLPYTAYRQLVDRRAIDYQSISISGHKFFGIDSPCGLFITTRDVYDHQVSFDIPYLNANMRMISCSRSGTEPLKFWWLIQTIGVEGWREQATTMLSNTEYLMSELRRIDWPCWSNDYSNTVFFRRPSDEFVKRFNLACSYDERFGGKLAHVVVMQHVSREAIDRLIAALQDSKAKSKFVLVGDVIPDAILEIRYYSTFNFIGDRIPGYNEPIAILTRQAADSLRAVSDELRSEGYVLKIYDAYRPQCAVDYFMQWAEDTTDVRMKPYFYPEVEKSVIVPEGYVARRSSHTRGSTIDLTLYDIRLQRDVDMGCWFDYFGLASHPTVQPGQEIGAYQPINEEQYRNRMILREAMLRHGFNPYDCEWWHFTLKDEPFPDTYFTFPIETSSITK